MNKKLRNKRFRKNYRKLQLAIMKELNILQKSCLLTVDEKLGEKKNFMKAFIVSISGLDYYELLGDKTSSVVITETKISHVIKNMKKVLKIKQRKNNSITEDTQLTSKQLKQKIKMYKRIFRRVNKYYSKIDWTSNMFTEAELNPVEIDDTFRYLKKQIGQKIYMQPTNKSSNQQKYIK